jgi:hypothetical protein
MIMLDMAAPSTTTARPTTSSTTSPTARRCRASAREQHRRPDDDRRDDHGLRRTAGPRRSASRSRSRPTPRATTSLEGVEWLGHGLPRRPRRHGQTTTPVTEDVDFNHEAEFTKSGKNIIVTDERGGGVTPPGATCDVVNANSQGNGGIHAYQVDELKTERPVAETDAEEADLSYESYARGTDGEKAVFRAPIRTGAEGTFCTSHVMQQIPGQNRIFMGWYSQGTRSSTTSSCRVGSSSGSRTRTPRRSPRGPTATRDPRAGRDRAGRLLHPGEGEHLGLPRLRRPGERGRHVHLLRCHR